MVVVDKTANIPKTRTTKFYVTCRLDHHGRMTDGTKRNVMLLLRSGSCLALLPLPLDNLE
jgi:hypothetical protein